MDSFDFENVKSKGRSFRSLSFIFRAAEICVALLLVCWIFTCIPFAVRISGEFLRRLASLVSTPLFMFLLGNSIVVTLLTTKSSVFSSSGKSTNDGDGGVKSDIYDAFIRSGESRVNSVDGDLTEEIIVYDEKQIVSVTESVTNSNSNSNPTVAREDHVVTETEKDSVSVSDSSEDPPPTKIYRRSKSEISEIVTKPSLLRRSETEKCRKIVESYEEVPFPEDNLTNEEFQKTIEAFIARQLIFRRRESLAVVIHNKV